VLQRFDQVAKIGLMQLGDQRTKKGSITGFDAGSDLSDELLANRAIVLAHRHAREEGLTLARRNHGGLLLIVGHEHPSARA
jgi:metallophosphoesterase superfamily enzyme